MIGRLLHGTMALVLYFCLATLISEIILANYLWGKWKLDRGRLLQIAAVAQGLAPTAAGPGSPAEPIAEEQPSYDQFLATRATRDLNLQLREQALANSLAELRSGQQSLSQAQGQLARQRQQYETQLKTLQEDSEGAGSENVLLTLSALKPKQAKELLLTMLGNRETQAVVTLLRDMPDKKRAKVVAEFKTPDEVSKIEEILRLIRTGAPEADLAKQSEQQLQGKSAKD